MKKNILLFAVLFLLCNSILKGQNNAPPLPQRTVSLNMEMPLNFGEFAIVDGLSGTVTVNSDGIQTASSNVVLLNKLEIPHRAELSFHLCPGRSLTISWQPTFTMSSDGTGSPVSVTLNSVKVGTNVMTNGQSFTSNKGCQDTHYIYVGGTLNLNAATTYHGAYTGDFWVTVNYQ